MLLLPAAFCFLPSAYRSPMLPLLSAWREAALDAFAAFVFPQGCHVCGAAVLRRADGVVCAACWAGAEAARLAGRAFCARCGAPGVGRCGRCVGRDLSAVRSAGLYTGALRAALLDLKRRPHACRRLCDLMADTYRGEQALHGADLIVPVPLHPERRAERGHNQAEVLARPLARATGLEMVPAALSRHRAAPPQRAGLDRAGREAAVSGAFRAARGLVAGRSVLLVDDVLTTGATLAACAAALGAAGARRVCALTAARAQK